MSLIKCSECGQDVSDQAPNCPHCGVIINKTKEQVETKKVDLNVNNFELTNKKWKKYYAWAIPMLIIGIPLFFFNLVTGMMGVNNMNAGWFFIGLLFCGIGGILFLVALIGSWWERG